MSLLNLVQDTRQWFIDHDIFIPYTDKVVPIEIGKRAVFKSGDTNRIVFISLGGTFGPAKLNTIPRGLGQYIEQIEVHIWGFDGYSSSTNALPGNVPGNNKNYLNRGEEFHDEQCKILLNQLNCAMYQVAYSNVFPKSARANNTPTENMFGRELILNIELKTPLTDEDFVNIPMPVIAEFDGYMIFPKGYQDTVPILTGGYVGDEDLDGNSTIAEPIIEEAIHN